VTVTVPEARVLVIAFCHHNGPTPPCLRCRMHTQRRGEPCVRPDNRLPVRRQRKNIGMNQNASDEMRTKYDFSNAVQGKHHRAYSEGTNVVVTVQPLPPSFRQGLLEPRCHGWQNSGGGWTVTCRPVGAWRSSGL